MNIPDDKNIYEYLKIIKSSSEQRGHGFQFQYYQTIPKYYLLSSTMSNLILGYQPGSGKTITSIFAFQDYFDNVRYKLFNEYYVKDYTIKSEDKTKLQNITKYTKYSQVSSNIVIVAPWMSELQFKKEFMNRVEFGYIDDEKKNKLKRFATSTVKDKVREGEIYRNTLMSDLNKLIRFMGYQVLFNILFPNVNLDKLGQNVDSLIEQYKNNELNIDTDFLESIRDGIVVVDEFQRLYSNEGLNTYGFAVAILNKKSKEYNFQLLFLTGTMINTSLAELPDIINIVSSNPNFIKRSDYIEEDENKNYMVNISEEKINESLEILKKRFLFFDPNPVTFNTFPMQIDKIVTNINDMFFFPSEESMLYFEKDMKKSFMNAMYLKNRHNLISLIYPILTSLPREMHIGNRIISDLDQCKENNIQPIILYVVKTMGLQNKYYEEYLSKTTIFENESDENDDEPMTDIIDVTGETDVETDSERVVVFHDAYIPKSTEYSKYGIYKHNNIFYGDFLLLENLWNFSAIGYEMCCLCMENTFNNEKTIVYHNKLNSFGLKQYAAILQNNGFLKHGSAPNKNSLCKNCKRIYSNHNLPLDERLKLKICNEFKPMYYELLIGDLTTAEREKINNEYYNSPLNKFGDIISVLFVSDVAYAGVNFLSTHNIFLLSKIPNLSKWKQITARIVRTESHRSFPPKKRYAKIYTFIIESETEYEKSLKLPKKINNDTIEISKLSREMTYYKKAEMLNIDIEKYTKRLSNEGLSSTILNDPSKYKYRDEKIKNKSELLLLRDIKRQMTKIVNKTMIDRTSACWNLDNYIKRIQNTKITNTFVDLNICSTDYLKSIVLDLDDMRSQKYNKATGEIIKKKDENQENADIYILFNYKQTKVEDSKRTISVEDFLSLETRTDNFRKAVKALDKARTYVEKLRVLTDIIKQVNKKYDKLTNIERFWELIFDIVDEYYEDDDKNFIVNHEKGARDRSKVVGFYYKEYIIFRDGTVKTIPISYLSIPGTSKIPYLFKITSISSKTQQTENSPWYLAVKIIDNKKLAKEITDKRKQPVGIACTSMDITPLKKYFNIKDGFKKDYCLALMFAVCKEQKANPEKFVYTPFEYN